MLGNLGRELIEEFVPLVVFIVQYVLFGLHHKVHLAFVINKERPHCLGILVHIAAECLTDEQPNHVGRKDKRTVVGKCEDECLVHHIAPTIDQFGILEAMRQHILLVTGYLKLV